METMANAEVQALVDDLAERLQRSVVIDDVQLNLLYSSPHFGDEDAVRVDSMLKRRTGSKAIGHVLAQGVVTWTRPGLIPPNDDLGLRARVCVPVRWQGELIAFIMVIDADGTLTTAETSQISTVAEVVAPLLVTELQGGEDTAEQTVRDLVSQDGALRRRALAEVSASDVSDDPGSVTAITLSVKYDAAEASLAHIAVALRSALMLPRPTGTQFQMHAVEDHGGVVVIGGPRPLTPATARTHAQRMLARVADLSSGRFKAVAGIGPAVAGLHLAHETAELANLAARAAEIGLVDEAARWEDLGPYGPLLRIPSSQLGRQALPAEVQRLLDIDRDGQLVATLRAFLDSAASAPVASAALQIHRTTLYYRLSRIEELLGIDLTDGRTRLSLHLGLVLLELIPEPSTPVGSLRT
jgi:sugar diacid utilization regulator